MKIVIILYSILITILFNIMLSFIVIDTFKSKSYDILFIIALVIQIIVIPIGLFPAVLIIMNCEFLLSYIISLILHIVYYISIILISKK